MMPTCARTVVLARVGAARAHGCGARMRSEIVIAMPAEGGQPRAPSLLDAILPVVVLIALIALTIVLFGVSATDGPLQVALCSAPRSRA